MKTTTHSYLTTHFYLTTHSSLRFDLDPNRVLDLVLETWQNYIDQSKFYIELVKLFPKQEDTLCSMLGYSFAHYEVTEVI